MVGTGGKGVDSPLSRGGGIQRRSNFLTRTAQDEAAQLARRSSILSPGRDRPVFLDVNGGHTTNPPLSQRNGSLHGHTSLENNVSNTSGGWFEGVKEYLHRRIQKNGHSEHETFGVKPSATTSLLGYKKKNKYEVAGVDSQPSRRDGVKKLGTFSGVFVPTTLNILSILMFLRFGFILGQGGLVGMMALLAASYLINLVTTLSISAIASNGIVRGGGAYYLISRSLGPEFGGSIGVVFYLGFVFNTGLNAVGLVDVLFQTFGRQSGDWANVIPEGLWWQYLWSSAILVLCTLICLAGSSFFSRCSNGLLAILLISTFSIPFSAIFLPPHVKNGVVFTGPSWKTLRENLMPRLTKHAAGSQLEGRETFQDLFGILFPATGGIFAGASMSSDLKNPSKSIPRGTLYGLGLTFFAYTAVVISMAATITRASLYSNVTVIQQTAISEVLIFMGELASSFFSVLMGRLIENQTSLIEILTMGCRHHWTSKASTGCSEGFSFTWLGDFRPRYQVS